MPKVWDYNIDKTSIVISPPSQRLRITGHRLSSVLGLNDYQTPFGAWAEITKLVKLPFEETKYTLFGKVVEPKLIQYVSEFFPNVMSIKDYYGNIFKQYEYNNFVDISDVFGGVIDAVSVKNDMKTIALIIECKSSSHPEQWRNGNVPVSYLLQGALYSYLFRLDRVVFVCTFPQEIDYANPENYKVNKDNTVVLVKKLEDMIFEVNGEYLNIEGCMEYARQWWEKHIETGVSPTFDEKKDKEYLDIIRATNATKDNDLVDVCEKAYELNTKIEELKVSSGLKNLESQLKLLETSIKNKMIETESSQCGKYKLTRKVSTKFNEDLFAQEKPSWYEAYCEPVESFTLSKEKIKKEEE